MTQRLAIRDKIQATIEAISSDKYSFDKYSNWQPTDTQYEKNHLDIRDEQEKSKRENGVYKTLLTIHVSAIIWESDKGTAEELGTLALADLIRAIRPLTLPGSGLIKNLESDKWVETKGRSQCQIELDIQVSYKL